MEHETIEIKTSLLTREQLLELLLEKQKKTTRNIRKRQGRRYPYEHLAEQAVGVVKSNPGMLTGELATYLGYDDMSANSLATFRKKLLRKRKLKQYSYRWYHTDDLKPGDER